MNRRPGYSKEICECAIRLVFTNEHNHSLRWAVSQSVAAIMGCPAETLRSWMKKMALDTGAKPGVTANQPQRTKALEREVRERYGTNKSSQ